MVLLDESRITLCPIGGSVSNAVHPSKANQCSPVLETYHLPREPIGWIMPILVRVISLEKRIPETLLFRTPFLKFSVRTHLRSPRPAPFNASFDGGATTRLMLQAKGATMRTTRNRLFPIFEIHHPSW